MTGTPLFHNLSRVKILPKAAVQEKKATLRGMFEHHIDFHKKRLSGVKKRDKYYSLTLKPLFFVDFQQSLSCPSPVKVIECVRFQKISKDRKSVV